jgi:5'-3' exoribonuclease 1
MGIKHFFGWFSKTFATNIQKMKKDQTFAEMNNNIDTFMIDLNGVFHDATQKVYEYGNHKPHPRMLASKKTRKRPREAVTQRRVFVRVCEIIDELMVMVKPNKRLVLCVDGPAPISKQNQQRQRRFRSAIEKSDEEFKNFDSNCITPGTQFMDYLSKYIDWHIRSKMSTDATWENIDVIFSNEKVPGEGEHKIINFIRLYGSEDETYCIHGLDADLIMLSLATHKPNFFILREDLYDKNNDFFAINIGDVRKSLVKMLRWDTHKKFIPKSAIDDFVFLCFMCGNDFLPHIPSIEIIEKGIEVILKVHNNVGKNYGHVTRTDENDKVVFVQVAFKMFLKEIASYEKGLLQEKLDHKHTFFPDPVLEEHASVVNGNHVLDIKAYRKLYYGLHFPDEVTEKKMCHDYLEGAQWVLSYYTRGVPNWKWMFPFHYAPFAKTLAKHTLSFVFPTYERTTPSDPFRQLLSVLPPKSASLIPPPLRSLLTDVKSPLLPFCPDEIDVDITGKRKKWEGIVILPMVKFDVFCDEYYSLLKDVNKSNKGRNRPGKTFIYTFDKTLCREFFSYYGSIQNCKVETNVLQL